MANGSHRWRPVKAKAWRLSAWLKAIMWRRSLGVSHSQPHRTKLALAKEQLAKLLAIKTGASLHIALRKQRWRSRYAPPRRLIKARSPGAG